MHNNYRFEIQAWDESTYLDLEDKGKFTRASIKKHYNGVLEGEGTLDYLMSYQADGNAHFVGIERVTGSIGERKGSFTLSHTGVFADGKVTSTFVVVEGSGDKDFSDFSGHGEYQTGVGSEVEFSFEHS
jgi:hypothetical protein